MSMQRGALLQELSPTSDTNLVKSLMNLVDCMMDEFHDEAQIAQMEEREITTLLEVSLTSAMPFCLFDLSLHHCS